MRVFYAVSVISLASLFCLQLAVLLRSGILRASVSIQVRHDHRIVSEVGEVAVGVTRREVPRAGVSSRRSSVPHRVSLPFPKYTKSLKKILQQPWVRDLRVLLKTRVAGKLVIPVFVNWQFVEPFLNWMISAQVIIDSPLQNVVVFAFDKETYTFLLRKKIAACFYIHPSSISKKVYKRTQFWVVRATILRLLNFWGYDVLNFDSDALVLKNPQAIFDAHPDSDVVASVGGYPMELNKVWGITLCMGVVLLRSTPRIESLWKHFSEANSTDDQIRINFALYNSNLRWLSNTSKIRSEIVEAQCDNGLKITAIPRNIVCRGPAPKPGVYVWHMFNKNVWKKTIAVNGKHWYLKDDWETPNSLNGLNWLASVTLHNISTHYLHE